MVGNHLIEETLQDALLIVMIQNVVIGMIEDHMIKETGMTVMIKVIEMTGVQVIEEIEAIEVTHQDQVEETADQNLIGMENPERDIMPLPPGLIFLNN